MDTSIMIVKGFLSICLFAAALHLITLTVR